MNKETIENRDSVKTKVIKRGIAALEIAALLATACGSARANETADPARAELPKNSETLNLQPDYSVVVESITGDKIATETSEETLSENLWGTYIVDKNEFKSIEAIKLLAEGDIDENLKSAIEKKFLRYYGPDAKYSYLEIEGDGKKAILPFVWTLDGDGKVVGRWMAWSMGEGGTLTLPSSENLDNIVFVGLSKLVLPSGGVFIGPTRGTTVSPFIVQVNGQEWFISDLPNVEEGDYFIPLENNVLESLENFLSN